METLFFIFILKEIHVNLRQRDKLPNKYIAMNI